MSSISFSSHQINFIVILIVLLGSSSFPLTLANSICKHHEYWDSNLEDCVPCTKCNRHQIVIRPCQRHLDTVCRPINSIDIDWNKSMMMATDKNILRRVCAEYVCIRILSKIITLNLSIGASSCS